MRNIKNFSIIAHIDHGKSTLADRLLELTGSIDKRQMKAQVLDTMDIERERGITIKLQPAKMTWQTLINADTENADSADEATKIGTDKKILLYKELTYKIRGAAFNVYNQLGAGHKESVYQKALAIELKKGNIAFEQEKDIDVVYDNSRVGKYRPDFLIDNKVIIELKAIPFIGILEKKQLWHYLRGSDYRLALIINFGHCPLQIERVVYDTARDNIRVNPRLSANPRQSASYELNLIDTPGHVDFSYEVSRSLAAVEGVILVVDATQGVQAQTLANLHLAQASNLAIIPVINKIDLAAADIDKTIDELLELNVKFACEPIAISAKSGTNVQELLDAIVKYIPSPKGSSEAPTRALIFDSYFDSYRGVITYIRVVDGSLKAGDKILMMQTQKSSEVLEVGSICVGLHPTKELSTGQIGYIVTSFKDITAARVGDTITSVVSRQTSDDKLQTTNVLPLPGYKEPQPMVYAGLYTASGDDYQKLRDALSKLKLNDASLQYEPASSTAFGFGFRAGFLGLLHLEIVKERLEREYDLDLVVTTPTVAYRQQVASNKLQDTNKLHMPKFETPNAQRPTPNDTWEEPWVKLEILLPEEYLGGAMQLITGRRGVLGDVKYLGTRVILEAEMPLAEVIIDFYDKTKAVTSGYGSVSYDITGYRPADLVQLDVLVAGDKVDALSRLVPKINATPIGRKIVEKLKEAVPRQGFEVKLQAAIGATIIASERIAPFRKDVTEKLYGGDITRKRKLLEKQKKGKRKMARLGSVEVPTEVFIKLLKH